MHDKNLKEAIEYLSMLEQLGLATRKDMSHVLSLLKSIDNSARFDSSPLLAEIKRLEDMLITIAKLPSIDWATRALASAALPHELAC